MNRVASGPSCRSLALVYPLAAALVMACASPANNHAHSAAASSEPGELAVDVAAIERDVARIRVATEPFKSLDQAVAAGYQREVGQCIDNPPQGAMGYHHPNRALLDDTIEIDKPEMLVYERLPNGEYRLNGVEYIVPLSIWPQTREPPVVMGQQLKPAPSLGIWYRHVWVWRENPSGLFEDWNPNVKC
jgi:hypothetical protein